MMQVQETKNEGLQRGFTVTVPASELDAALTRRLEGIAASAKMQGFRPGKVPMTLIRQRYADAARAEILEQTVSDSVDQALAERKLRPAAQPKVDLVSAEEGKDLTFQLDVEVLPEIKPMDFSKLSLERHVADVEDKTVQEALERLAKSIRDPEVVTEKRAAKKGDVAVIDFDGSVDGKAFPGMKGENHKLELGSNSFIPGFEDQVIGMKAGDKKDVKVTFPAAYHAAHLAGKDAVFAVTLHEIRAHGALEIDDALAKEVGIESADALRKRIADDIAADYAKVGRLVLKRALMDKLADSHDFEIPQSMVEAEFENIWQQISRDKAAGQLSDEDAKKDEETLKADYRKIAVRRIRLGLLLAHLAEANKIEVAEAELRNAIIAETQRFPGQEKAVFDYFIKNRGAIERLRAPILEEKVVDFVLAQAKIKDKKITADDLMKMPEQMD